MNKLIKYIKNLSWLFVEKVFQIISGLVVGVWVARHLGTTDFGVLSYAQSFLAVFIVISKLGLDSIVIKNLVEKRQSENVVLGTALSLLGGASVVIVSIIYVISIYFIDDELTRYIIVLMSFSIMFQCSIIIDWYFKSKVLSKYVSATNSASLIISGLAKVYLIVYDYSLMYFACVYLFEALVTAILYCATYYFLGGKVRVWKYNGEYASGLLKKSWPLLFTSLLATMYARMDQLMIHSMLTASDVGLFSASVRITEAWLFIPMIISSTFYPNIIESKEESNAVYMYRLRLLFGLVGLISLMVGFVVSVNSDLILNVLFGSEYASGAVVLKIRIWETVLASIAIISSQWIVVENLQKQAIKFVLGGFLINILMNYWLIPTMGIEGAALSSLISIIFTVIVLPIADRRFWQVVEFRIKALVCFYIVDVFIFCRNVIYRKI